METHAPQDVDGDKQVVLLGDTCAAACDGYLELDDCDIEGYTLVKGDQNASQRAF